MKRSVKLIAKTLAVLTAVVILLSMALVAAVNNEGVQQRLLQRATALLSERLATTVAIGHITVDVAGQRLMLQDVAVDDLQRRRMLQIDELGVHLELSALMRRRLLVTEAHVEGLTAKIWQARSDTAANYQFLIEALRDSTKIRRRDSMEVGRRDSKEARKLSFDIRRVRLEHIAIDYEKEGKEQHVRLAKGKVRWRGATWSLTETAQQGTYSVELDSLCLVTDNHLPRKNHGKPKRGFFDAGHLNIMASLAAEVTPIGKDSVEAVISRLQATDIGSRLTVKRLTARVAANRETANVEALTVSLPQTTLNIPRAMVRLPGKENAEVRGYEGAEKRKRRLAWSAPRVEGRVVLQDIAHAFAPVLKNFKEPLQLQTAFSGTDEGMRFTGVKVSTADDKLKIKAAGGINNLKKRRGYKLHFDVQQMTAQRGVAERIINQFPVKRLMIKQLEALSNIGYQGSFDVVWRRETFKGLLTTAGGPLKFNFTIDGNSKYVTGTVKTDSFELGRVMKLKQVSKIACEAQFKIDISKPRTARMRREKGGHLPIGEVEAHVFEAKHQLGRVKNLQATIVSDGAVAQGNINIHGKHLDVVCSFSFTNTDEMHKMKVKPGLKFHKLTDEDRAAKEARKAEKKAAKEQHKAEKAAAKEQRKAEKATAKEQRKAEKAAAKEQRKAEKAARKVMTSNSL